MASRKPRMSPSGSSRWCDRVAEPLEAIHLQAPGRIDRAELVRDQDPSAGAGDAGELGDRRAPAGARGGGRDDSTRGRTRRSRTAAPSTSPSSKRTFAGARLPAGLEVVGRACRRRRPRRRAGRARTRASRFRSRRRARPPFPRTARAAAAPARRGRPRAPPGVRAEARRSSVGAPLASSRASASASSRVEIVPAARSSSMTARIRPISGPGSSPSSSPRTSGSAGSASRAASTTPASSCGTDEREGMERPRLGRPVGTGGSREATDPRVPAPAAAPSSSA